MTGIAAKYRLESMRSVQQVVGPEQPALTLNIVPLPTSCCLWVNGVWERNMMLQGAASVLLPAPDGNVPRTVELHFNRLVSAQC